MAPTRRADGRYQTSVSLAGRKRYVYGRTPQEAREKAARLRAQALALGQLPTPGRRTLGDLVAAWLAAAPLRPKTRHGYQQVLAPVLATLGRLPLARLDPAHLQALYARLGAEHGARAAWKAHQVLHRALAVGVQWGWLATNPADRVLRPRYQPAPRPVLAPEQGRALLQALAGDRYYPLFLLLATTGCRLSEALGLEWPDVDLARGTVTFRRALVEVGSQPVLGPLKSRAAHRTVPLLPSVVEALQRWRLLQLRERLRAGSAWQDARGAVFTTRVGTPPLGRNLRRALRRAAAQAGLAPVRIHDLRHAVATWAAAAGVDVKTLQTCLGHADARTTLNVYAGVLEAGAHRVGQAVAAALGQ
ncbi:MAG TPA: site-specific integrase [Chloroflexota bacterium]|nr:site-specific integrase [Chloroflexota bacterium]